MSEVTQAQLDHTTQLGTQAMAEAHDAKRWDRCVEVGDAWLEARGEMPALCAVWYAQSLMAMGRLDEAVHWAKVPAERLPSGTLGERIAQCAARSTYAQALARVGRFVKAKSVMKQMASVPVEHPETLEKQGHILLAISDKWRQGWAMHEARSHNATLPDDLPRWNGMDRGTVGVLHEQGIGDAILFARWLPELAEKMDHVVWFGPEQVLGRWMRELPNVIVGKRGEHRTPVDAALYAMSLPHVLGCDRPSDVPPPVAPRSLLEQRSTYSPNTPLRVGVCWRGSPDGWHDFERSFTVEQFAPVFAPLDGVEFVNLCHDAEVPDSAPFVKRAFADVYETGQEIAGLDLVVSVDTSVVHLAGSLGVPTLCLAPTVPDWRYDWPAPPKQSRRSPGTKFYPSVTVIRRQRGDDLSPVQAARAMIESFSDLLT